MTSLRHFAPIHRFTIWHEVDGARTIAAIALREDVEDFNPWLGETVMISGLGFIGAYKIKAVEHFAHAPPWRRNEIVGLHVEPAR